MSSVDSVVICLQKPDCGAAAPGALLPRNKYSEPRMNTDPTQTQETPHGMLPADRLRSFGARKIDSFITEGASRDNVRRFVFRVINTSVLARQELSNSMRENRFDGAVGLMVYC